MIDPENEGFEAAFVRSMDLVGSSQPIFEAGFSAEGARAFADVMLPVRKAGKRAWRMVEVKSSTSIKDYHRDDAAVQAYVARSAGVPLVAIALAHIDKAWVYPGDNDYQGLLVECDLTAEAFSRKSDVKAWIAEAQTISRKRKGPVIGTGQHCTDPYECGFLGYCQGWEPPVQYPVSWLPRVRSKVLKSLIEEQWLIDFREAPDDLLNDRQRRVKTCTLSDETYFDAKNAASDLAAHKPPAYFLDFEIIQFAVPIWKGTRPCQKMPFQFSAHRLSRKGKLEHQVFLDLSGNDPSKAFAEALIAACGERGPVFVYNAGFETTRIRELADRLPRLKRSLLAINERVVDLLKVAEQRYYHPSQQGSWSLKKILPAIAPDLGYVELEGVQDGEMAMSAYLEAISSGTTKNRKAQIRQQLLNYCELDTYALVRLWQFFSGRTDLAI